MRAKRGGAVAFGGNNQGGAIDVATACNGHAGPHGRLDFEIEPFVTYPLTGNPYGDHESRDSLLVVHSLRADGFDASEDGSGRGTPIIPVLASGAGGANSAGIGKEGDPAMALDSTGAQAIAFNARQDPCPGPIVQPLDTNGSTHAIAFAENSRAEVRLEGGDGDVAGSLKAGGGKPGQSYPTGMQGMGVRRLTPVECERLQGLPDNWTAIPWRKRKIADDEVAYYAGHGLEVWQNEGQWYTRVAPDGPRYKAIGNAMAVPVMQWVGERIKMIQAVTAANFPEEAAAVAG